MLDRKVVEKTIGKTFADRLDESILNVSRDLSFTRREMVELLGCANFVAAARLEKVLKRLKIHTPAQLHKTDPFSLLRSRGIGETSMFVAMCILEANEFDVEKWWGWKQGDNVVKFSTFKHHAAARARKHKQEVA
jgi:hypothetical protein